MPPDTYRDDVPDNAGHPGGVSHPRVEFTVPAVNEAVPDAISKVLSCIDISAVDREDVNGLEIALAEAFNNVIEHAYDDRGIGQIMVTAEVRDPGLHITIWDEGRPMPAGRLPGGAPANPELSAQEQAEGGYGLYLIRNIARKLRYERVGDKNRLSFRIRLNPI